MHVLSLSFNGPYFLWNLKPFKSSHVVCLTALRVIQGCLSSTPRKQINSAHRRVSRGLRRAFSILACRNLWDSQQCKAALFQIRYILFLFVQVNFIPLVFVITTRRFLACEATSTSSGRRYKSKSLFFKKRRKEATLHKQEKMNPNNFGI